MKIWISIGSVAVFMFALTSLVSGLEKKPDSSINLSNKNNKAISEKLKAEELRELIKKDFNTCQRHPERLVLSHMRP